MPGEITPTGTVPAPELRASHADRDRAMEVLRVAAGDGRLTPDELDERLEAADAARTVGQLAVLTADLPPVSSTGGGAVAEVKDVVRVEQRFSPVTRTGRWVVPRRLELDTDWCDVTLDLSEAVVTQEVLRIDAEMTGGRLTLVVPPGTVVDTESAVRRCKRASRRGSCGSGTTLR
ncbi:DUF1707 domain-containing protein [Streptomyces sp. NPDC001941]|uniref:DUF1707 SHOCT-like domain-containing protein n=1 Tax=Streptomyces sp. NPDC001941 TaxID=3154659 RepID=UPI003320CDDA